jgi:hypothetical protein
VPAVLAALSLALPAPVAAASLTLDPDSGFAGASVNAIGADYPRESPILVLWDGTVIRTVASSGTADRFRIEFRVPGDAPQGPHVVTMCVANADLGACGTETAEATFTVVLPASPTPDQPDATLAPEPEAPPPESSPLPLLVAVLFFGGVGAYVYRSRMKAAAAKREAERKARREGGQGAPLVPPRR